jgi:hypothetical protein
VGFSRVVTVPIQSRRCPNVSRSILRMIKLLIIDYPLGIVSIIRSPETRDQVDLAHQEKSANGSAGLISVSNSSHELNPTV